MTFNEGTCIKGKFNNRDVIGYVIFDENNNPFITGEKCYLSEMTDIQIDNTYQFNESDMDKNVSDIVNNDFKNLDKKRIMKMKDKEAEKVGDAREKELKKAGVKLQPGQYKDKFVAAQKAVAATGILADEIGDSKVLVKYESESDIEKDKEQLYGDTIPAQVSTAVTGTPIDIENHLDDADWSHFQASNQQATSGLDFSDVTLNKIDNPEITSDDEIDYSAYLDDSDIYDDDNIPANTDTYEDEENDIHIDITNPNDVPIQITVGDNEKVLQAKKEDEVSAEIEEELDNYNPTDEELAESDFKESFINHISNKYKIEESKLAEWKTNKLDLLNCIVKEIASR